MVPASATTGSPPSGDPPSTPGGAADVGVQPADAVYRQKPRRGRNASRPEPRPTIDKSVLTFSEPKRIRDKEHLKFVGQHPCLICGRIPPDAHHLRFAQLRALGRKVSDEFTVPVCRTHHRELHLDLIARSGARPNIPSCSRRIVRRSVDPAIYRQRNLIERFFCKLKQFRRVATRFDKLARNFLAAVLIVLNALRVDSRLRKGAFGWHAMISVRRNGG
jgi:transposase